MILSSVSIPLQMNLLELETMFLQSTEAMVANLSITSSTKTPYGDVFSRNRGCKEIIHYESLANNHDGGKISGSRSLANLFFNALVCQIYMLSTNAI
jgi:hypothetical protein